mgnify:CR=1 FL=1
MRMKTLFITTAATAMAVDGQTVRYPQAPKDGTVDEYFGVKVADPFRPLEDDTCAATAAWVEAENRVTNAYLAKIPQRDKYLRRLKQVVNYEKVYTPFEKNGKWYVYKNNGMQNQAVLYQMDRLGGEQRVFLDPNKLSDDGTVALKNISFSNDGRYFAYVISRSGSDWEEIYVMDVKTGKLLPDHIVWAKFTGATIALMTLRRRARRLLPRTRCRRCIIIRWAPRRARMCSSIRILPTRCASIA